MRGEANQKSELGLVSDEAAEWFVRLCDLSAPMEARGYLRWLKMSPLHVAAALDVARVNQLLRQATFPSGCEQYEYVRSNVTELFQDVPQEWRTERPTRRMNPRLRQIAAVALGGALAMSLGVMTMTSQHERSIETAAGEWRVQALADGSRVRVGPRSRMQVEFDERRRLVRLSAGDAVFEVAKDEQRPFLVDTGVGTARAAGTRFGVALYDSKMVVTVTQGVVAVAPCSGSPRRASSVETSVHAGEQVGVSLVRSDPVRQVDVEHELAWVREKLIFYNRTIGHAVDEFNRRNRVQLAAANRETASHLVKGVFDAADPRAFAEFLELEGVVRVSDDRPDHIRLESVTTSHDNIDTQARPDHNRAAGYQPCI